MLALDRGDRRGDTLACGLIALALASSGLGIAVAAGLLVEVLWRRRQWREAWIALAPLALYAVWWLVYQDTELVRGNIVHAPRFAAGAAAGAVGALSGLTEIRVDASGAIDDAGAALVWGRPLAVAAAFVLAWRLAAVRPLSARIVGLMAMALTFWLLTGLQRAHVGSPDASRYLYVGALFVVLLGVELARGVSLGRAPAVVMACAAGLVVVSNLGDLRTGARYLRSQAPVARADLGALELARAQVPAGYVATSFPGDALHLRQGEPLFRRRGGGGHPGVRPGADRRRARAGAPDRGRRARIDPARGAPSRPRRREHGRGSRGRGGHRRQRRHARCVRPLPACDGRPGRACGEAGAHAPAGRDRPDGAGGQGDGDRAPLRRNLSRPAARPAGRVRVGCPAHRDGPRPAALARPRGARGRRDRMRPPLRRSVETLAAAFVFAGPTVLAFRSGGYYTEPRLLAGIVAWALVLALALTGRAPLPRSRPGWLALAGLVLLTAWSALAITWAPLGGPAVQQVQRLVLYVGALLLALGVLRSPRALRAVEPALAPARRS